MTEWSHSMLPASKTKYSMPFGLDPPPSSEANEVDEVEMLPHVICVASLLPQ